MQKTIRITAIFLAISIIAAGLFFSGSPLKNQELKRDFATLDTLEQAHCRLSRAYHHKGALPKTLEAAYLDMEIDQKTMDYCGLYCYDGSSVAPNDFAHITYTPSGKKYTVCAQFHHDFATLKTQHGLNKSVFFWAKPMQTGKSCFTREVMECRKD